MKSVVLQLPDSVAKDIEKMIHSGWFANDQELVRLALMEFMHRNRLELVERFQTEDIDWALKQRGHDGLVMAVIRDWDRR